MTCDGVEIYYCKEFVKEYVSQLDPTLKSNPKFLEIFSKELKYVIYKTNSDNFSIYTSLDRKAVTIVSTNPIVDCAVKELRGVNRAFIHIFIHLNGEDLYDEYSQGVLFDRKKVEENGMVAIVPYECKFETTYFLSCYNKEGVEFSNSSFSDSYPLNKDSKFVDLRDQTLSSFHKPVFYEKALPKAPIHILKAKARNTYRKKDNLSIIHTNLATMTSKGYENVVCCLYAMHPMFPEMLRGSSLIAKSIEQNGHYIFVPDNNYAPSVEEGYKRAKTEMIKSIEESKENINPITYQYLINNI